MMNRSRMRWSLLVLVAVVVQLSLVRPAWSQFPGLRFIPVAGGFTAPVHLANAGDGSGRLFVVEQHGTIRIIQNGTVLPLPFLDITAKVIQVGNERGLLSVTFPPQFASKQYFYVNYTRVGDGATVISRYQVTADPNLADPASEEILLVIIQPFSNHNGGMMAFSPIDGYLYIGMGDGGGAGDPNNFAQNTTPLPGNQHLLGKILRIDVESGAVPYAIPPTNPLFGGVRNEIWSRGLRNPWKFSFDSLRGALYIADVGQSRREEINVRPAASTGGENYGWRILEGSLCFNPATNCVPPPQYVPPVAEYSHPTGCSVTGGYVYRGLEYPILKGLYLFGDFCAGSVWGLAQSAAGYERQRLIDTTYNISTFGEGEDGSLFLADHTLGDVYKIAGTTRVIFPNGGEAIPAGSDQMLRWGAAADIRSFTIHFSLDNGQTWNLIRRNVPRKNLLWTVPAQAATSTTCLLRVTGFGLNGVRVGADRSDRPFTITAGP